MPMSDTLRAHLQIHLCVVLWGFTAIFGKLITLPALPLVWWRMMLVTAALALLPRVWRALARLPLRQTAACAGIGLLVALHWLTFYGSIKLANASVGATCMALATVFTALIEPRLTGRPFSMRDAGLALLVLPAVVLIVGGVPAGMHLGIAVGALSALLVAVFSSLNKRLATTADPLAITAIELGAGTALLTLLAPLMPLLFAPLAGAVFAWPQGRDLLYLAILAGACTLLPFALSLLALRHISAFSAQLAVNLEPVYAIALAMVLFNEQRDLAPAFYAGVALLLAVVVLHPLLTRPRRIEHVEALAVAESKDITR